MDSVDRFRRRKSLQERLAAAAAGSDHDDDDIVDPDASVATPPAPADGRECAVTTPRMNLAAALAAERRSGETLSFDDEDNNGFAPGNVAAETATTTTESPRGSLADAPPRMSLMKLLEETDGQDGAGLDPVCCVCMGRKKGAAFIPCGHTFCRVCCRELQCTRGSCPLCNRSIIEILHIY